MNKVQKKDFTRWSILLLSVFIFRTALAKDPIPAKRLIFTLGIDISHYVGHVNWLKFATSDHDIEFVFMRSTMGDDRKDSQFERNWKKAGENGYIRGAYHYYRPYENSAKQFKNYSRHVKLIEGDFPPILDVEKLGPYSINNLRKGVLNWLKLAEEYYNVKPVLYTGLKFYTDYLKGYVDDYPLWIASYSENAALDEIDWTFHQFSDKFKIKGAKESVDGNYFKGDLEELKEMRIK